MEIEELWQLLPIILKEHNWEYKVWYDIEVINSTNKPEFCQKHNKGHTKMGFAEKVTSFYL